MQWLALARLMLQGAGLAAGAFAGTELLERGFGDDGGSAIAAFPATGHPGIHVRIDPRTGRPFKRRRRRRALTASDRADIGFIVGLLGPKAGDRFAVTLAARAR